jgi:hypothetical protein
MLLQCNILAGRLEIQRRSPHIQQTVIWNSEPFPDSWSNPAPKMEFTSMSDLVFSVFAFHFIASLVWFGVCGFGALKVVTQRVKQRFGSAITTSLVNAAS